MAEVRLKIGDMVHTLGGRDGRIAEFSHDTKKAKVKFVFGSNHGWYPVEDCQLVQSPLERQAAAPSSTEAYPVGKILTNVAGEMVKVISQWKEVVKLQYLEVDGRVAETVPKGEPFTLSEQDVHHWLLKWLKPGDVVELHDGRIAILREIRLNGQIPESEQREYHLGIRFASENPLAKSVGTVYAESIKSKSTAPVAEAFRILAEPGSANELQRTIDSLRTEVTLLHRENDNLKASPPQPSPQAGREQSVELTEAIEDAAKSKAALADAENRIRNLEDKNRRQSKMLSEASAALPNPIPQPLPHSNGEGEKHVMTLVTIAGSIGFGNIEVPTGYQVAAITTEFVPVPGTPQIYRFVHLIGCGDSNHPKYEEKTERIPVVDDAPMNSFEAALKGGLMPEDVIAVGNEQVMALAREAARIRRDDYQPVPMMLSGGES
jgi:hypothetical protein